MMAPRIFRLCGLVAAAAALLDLTGHGPHAVGYLSAWYSSPVP
jgi:hypothetical protein